MMYFAAAAAAYLLLVNVIAFAMCGSDKRRAKKKKRRIPEKSLFTISALGGAFGFYLGMSCFRHKTQHTSFKVGIPLLCILWCLLIGGAAAAAIFFVK